MSDLTSRGVLADDVLQLADEALRVAERESGERLSRPPTVGAAAPLPAFVPPHGRDEDPAEQPSDCQHRIGDRRDRSDSSSGVMLSLASVPSGEGARAARAPSSG